LLKLQEKLLNEDNLYKTDFQDLMILTPSLEHHGQGTVGEYQELGGVLVYFGIDTASKKPVIRLEAPNML